MGKDLRGKELGEGVSQRKDGLYSARFRSVSGKRIERYFEKPLEAKRWLNEAKYKDTHGNIAAASGMLTDAWFTYWLENIEINSIRETTYYHRSHSYNYWIKPEIGNMLLCEVKPIHCSEVLNKMARAGKKRGTIDIVKSIMRRAFASAVENDLISKSPITQSMKTPCLVKEGDDSIKYLTIDDQKKFLAAAANYSHYNDYALVLQTGLRYGELVGLQWQDIDFANRLLHVKRQAYSVRANQGGFKIGEPKTSSGYRAIPLTDEAIAILENQKKLSKSSKMVSFRFADHVFHNKDGGLMRDRGYNVQLKYICEAAGIEPISLHALRHTFATRCIESGMRPKTLQKILGHSSIEMTMNCYVHLTEDEAIAEMQRFQVASKKWA